MPPPPGTRPSSSKTPRQPTELVTRLSRPSTASRERLREQYSIFSAAAKSKCSGVDHVTKTMEYLCCAQQLDFAALQSQIEARRRAPTHNPPSPRDAHRGVVLERRMATVESQFAKKWRDLVVSESKRNNADELRLARPLAELALRRAMLWAKIVRVVLPLARITETMRESKAKVVLRALFAGQVRRYLDRRKRKKARREWEAQCMATVVRPLPQSVCAAIPFFVHVPPPSVTDLIEHLQPKCFKAHEYICMSIPHAPTTAAKDDGTLAKGMSDDAVFLIVSGKVRVTHFFESSGKGVKDVRKVVEDVACGQAIGLEALSGQDAHRRVGMCLTDVFTWTFSTEQLQATIAHCPPSVQKSLQEITCERRKDIMRLQPMRESDIRQASQFLSDWSSAGINGLIGLLEPRFYRSHSRITKDKVSGIYFVAHGRLQVHRGNAQVEHVRAGQCFGELACYINEEKMCTITAVEDSEVWFLHKTDLLEYSAHEQVFTLLPIYRALTHRATVVAAAATGREDQGRNASTHHVGGEKHPV